MRVLLASKALVVGAYQRKLVEIGSRADVDLIAVVPPSWRDGPREQKLERLHVDGYQLIVSPLAVNGNFHLFFFPELGRLIDHYQPDIVHIDEEAYNLATFMAVWHCSRRQIPAVFFTWQNLNRSYPPPFRWMERYVFTHAAAAIAGTPSAERVLRAKGYRGSVAAIPQFGVDPAVYTPSTVPPGPKDFTIGFGGRLVPEKGVPVLLEACSQLGGNWRLVVVGDGPEGATIRARAVELGTQGRIDLRGAVASKDMPSVLQELDTLVLPSLSRPNWTEQFGRILVEAMACGVPVVGSSCGEIPSVIGDAGIVFPEGEVQALTAALRRLRDDLGLRAELSALGRQRVLEHFTHARVAEESVALYRRILVEHPQPSVGRS